MLLALFLASLKIYGIVSGIWGIIFIAIAILLMITALLNFCMIYHLKRILSVYTRSTSYEKRDHQKMKLEVTDKKSIKDIRKLFSDYYPFLEIEFYDEQHKYEEASSSKRLLQHDKIIGDIRKKHKGGIMRIYSWQKTGDIEQKFRRLYDLNVQIFRRQGDRWIQTAGSDELTLGEQNEIGYKATEKVLHSRENPIETEKRL
jgi:hypothetical protein